MAESRPNTHCLRRRALALVVPVVFISSAAAAPEGDPPTNVLILLADDVGVDSLTAYGLGTLAANTPNLDALAAGGVRFKNAYSNPTCSPTRATVLTGRYSFRTGIGAIVDTSNSGLPLSEVTLPEMLDLGAATDWSHALFGKWHLGSTGIGGPLAPNMAGFDHFAGSLKNLDPPAQDFFSWDKIVDGVTTPVVTYATTAVIDDALAWISTAQEPWLSVVSFHAAHTPYHAPPAALHTVDLTSAGPPEQDPVPYYRAMIEAMDAEIGRLLVGLGTTIDNTLVIFLGDNGTPSEVTLPPFSPDHAKGQLFQEGTRIPLLIQGPQVASPGSTCEALVNTTDFFATVAEIAAVDTSSVMPPGQVLDSISLLPLLADPTAEGSRELAFSERFWPNQPHLLVPIEPLGYTCQPSLFPGGTTVMELSVCGGALVDGNNADLLVTGAPPFAQVWLAVGANYNPLPLPLLGGTQGPNPIAYMITALVDGKGELQVTGLKGSLVPFTIYFQVVAQNPEDIYQLIWSNVIEAHYLGANSKAVFDGQYKLISSVLGGPDQFYDLLADPLEESSLLDAPLDPALQAKFDQLKADLAALIAP